MEPLCQSIELGKRQSGAGTPLRRTAKDLLELGPNFLPMQVVLDVAHAWGAARDFLEGPMLGSFYEPSFQVDFAIVHGYANFRRRRLNGTGSHGAADNIVSDDLVLRGGSA